MKTLCCAVLVMGAVSPVFAEAPAAPVTLNIQAQPLEKALQAFSAQSGLQVIFPTELTEAMTAPALEGKYTAEAALQRLLEKSGLQYAYVNARTVAIRAAQKEPAARAEMEEGVLRLAQGEGSSDASGSVAAGEGGQEKEGAGDAARDSQDVELEEIVVTAQKREERLIDAPQSVSVLSADALAKLGATQFRDFANTVPGLNFTTAGAGNTQISLRGVTTGFDVSPTTAIYIDEVPYGSSTPFANSAQLGLDPALFGLERIEVLRGPQGTIYGASAMGGLIKYVTRQPGLSDFDGAVQAGVSSTSHGGVGYVANASVNVPLVADKAGLRASAFESHDGGYVDNLALGREDVNQSDVYGARLDLLLAPAEALTVRVNAFLQNISRDGDATADYTFTGEKPNGSLGQVRPAGDPFDQRYRLASGTVTYDFGSAALTSISSYQTVKSEFLWDLSAIYVPFFATCTNSFCPRSFSSVSVPVESATDKFTQEIRLASDTGRTVEWLLGGFFTHENSSLEEAFALRDLAGQPALNDLFTFFVPSGYEEYAAFGDLTWRLTEKFDATGGVRYAHNRQSFSQTGSGAFGLNAPTNRATDDVLTYLANMRYHFSDRATGYLRYATGYRPGGPAYITVDPITGEPNGPPTFEADRLKSYEVGYKAETDDRRFGVELAGYYIDWSNIQVTFNNNGFSSVRNVPGGAGIQGAELALTARPTRALTLAGAFAYQNARLKEADTGLGAANDERLPNVPRFTGSISADYSLPMGTWEPTIGATLRHVGDRKSGFGAGAYRLPEYTMVDLRTGVTFGSIEAQLHVRNLFDERGQLSIAYPQFGGRVAIVQPRTIGINLIAKF